MAWCDVLLWDNDWTDAERVCIGLTALSKSSWVGRDACQWLCLLLPNQHWGDYLVLTRLVICITNRMRWGGSEYWVFEPTISIKCKVDFCWRILLGNLNCLFQGWITTVSRISIEWWLAASTCQARIHFFRNSCSSPGWKTESWI